MGVCCFVVRSLASQDLPSLSECIVRIHKSDWNMLAMQTAKYHINIYHWCMKTWKARFGGFCLSCPSWNYREIKPKCKLKLEGFFPLFCYFVHFWGGLVLCRLLLVGACKHKDVKKQEHTEGTTFALFKWAFWRLQLLSPPPLLDQTHQPSLGVSVTTQPCSMYFFCPLSSMYSTNNLSTN